MNSSLLIKDSDGSSIYNANDNPFDPTKLDNKWNLLTPPMELSIWLSCLIQVQAHTHTPLPTIQEKKKFYNVML